MNVFRYSTLLRRLVQRTYPTFPNHVVASYRPPILPFRLLSTSKNNDSNASDRRTTIPSTLSTTLRVVKTMGNTASSLYTTISSTPQGRLMRLDKPTGTHLLFLPAAWSITVGTTSTLEALYLLPLFYSGAILLRGAGCTINDIWDADIDRRVARTKSRPIPSGEITTTSAFLLLGAQLTGGLFILTQLNSASFLIGTLSVLPVLFYPFAKRHTAYPQAVLGLTFNWSALLGSTAATGTITPTAALLYAAGWCWTMVYDTIYAHQDKRDDAAIGISSTALTFADRPKATLAFFAAGKVGLLAAAGVVGDLSWPYFACIGASGAHIAWQIAMTNLDDGQQCREAFESNTITGAITWLGIIAGRIF